MRLLIFFGVKTMKRQTLVGIVLGLGVLFVAPHAYGAATCDERLRTGGFIPTDMRPGETRRVEGYELTVHASDSAPAMCMRVDQLKAAEAQRAAQLDQAETARLAAEAKVSRQMTTYGFLLNHILEISGIALALVFLIIGVLVGRATKNGRRN